MTETRTLLARYVENGSESAFRELVEGYINLVYSTALRLVEGDAHRAEDVSQMVFVRLTQKARTLTGDVSLGGWLHRDTCHVAATLMRSERRRQVRERQAAEMNALEDDTNLDSVLPVLDDAINELAEQDREAIILRFFEQQNFRALAGTVGGSEDAARMRVNRALEKLHELLKSRGVALSITGLATLLGAKAVAAAPVGLAANVASGVANGAAANTAGTIARTVAKGWRPVVLSGVALVFMAGLGVYLGKRAAEKLSTFAPQKMAVVTASQPAVPQPTAMAESAKPTAPTVALSGMKFQALDANSDAPLPGAKLHVAYFRDGGEGKSAALETGADGSVQVDFPQPPYTSANLFVSAQGHVPLVTSWPEGNMPTNYVMKLPVGTVAGGTILNEAQQPIVNAKIEFYAPGGNDRTKKENIQYLDGATSQRTDANGRWYSDMMPADFEKIGVIVTHPDYALISTQLVVNTSSAADTVVVMTPGTLVAGAVTDAAGQPIAEAKVNEIQNRRGPNRTARTDASGRFELKHMNPGDLELAVQAPGFASVVRDLVVSNDSLELEFKLETGRIFRGLVLDDNGAPISNAVARTDSDNQGLRKFEWSARTDGQGRVEWNSAPTEPVLYWFEAPGFAAARDVLLKADGSEHEIRLNRPRAKQGRPGVRITGTVSDETGQPLDDFKVLIADHMYPDFPPEFSYATEGKGGVFDLRRQVWTGIYQIQIQKDGYVPAASTNLLVKDGDQTLAFSLHKDPGMSGTVSLPGGEPAVDATVFLYELQGGVYMDKPGTYRKEVPSPQHVQTDKNGRFTFATKLLGRGFIVIHDQGYAGVPLANFDGEIVLQSWGRVEGKLMVGGNPAAGQMISLGNVMYSSMPSPSERHFPPLSLYLTATTGPDGTFVFEKVPPGERWISQRLIRTATGPGRLYDTQGRPVTVAPGTVTHVDLGGRGQVVSGRAVFSGTTATPIKWPEVAVELALKIPGGPGDAPKNKNFSSPDAFMAAWKSYADADRAFRASDAGREMDRAQRSYTAYCTEDGSFSIADVPSGQYTLKIEIRQHTPMGVNEFDGKEVGTLNMEINVPETSDGGHEVMNLGSLEVPAASK